jgi:CBS domain-containing protein
MTVAAILKHKGCEVFTARQTDTIAEVARILSARRIGAVVVIDSVGQLLGILSERDVVSALSSNGAWALELSVGQVMTRTFKTASLHTTTGEALAMMAAGHYRYLPVVDRGALIGLISIGDVVKNRIMQHEIEVDTLRAYVSGADYAVTSPIPSWSGNGEDQVEETYRVRSSAMADASLD